MLKYLLILCFLFAYIARVSAQDTLRSSIIRKHGFKEYAIRSNRDTIYFYVYGKSDRPKRMVLFLSGSTPDPLFTYEWVNGKMKSYFWGHQDYKLLSDEYCFVVIAKKARQGVWDEAVLNKQSLTPYLRSNSLDYRVWQADEVINYCYKHILNRPERIIVYGHSEGFNVVSKLLTVNRKITHAGLWGGSAMPDYYDFIMFNRRSTLKGQISDSLASSKIDTLLMNYKDVFKSPDYAKPNSIYTNKRWISYAEPPINYLVKVKIPLYMVVSTKDENAPIESAFIVPLEFIRLGKTNLTYRTCVGCDHSFALSTSDGKVSYWKTYFEDFITWTDR